LTYKIAAHAADLAATGPGRGTASRKADATQRGARGLTLSTANSSFDSASIPTRPRIPTTKPCRPDIYKEPNSCSMCGPKHCRADKITDEDLWPGWKGIVLKPK